jgi:hypothetical protein
MSNITTAIDLVISWLAKALACLLSYAQKGDTTNVGMLILDIQAVINAHLLVLKSFIPDKSVGKIPSNFFAKLAWVASNSAFLTLLVTLTSGTDPFAEAAAEAKGVALKWGFYTEVYGE